MGDLVLFPGIDQFGRFTMWRSDGTAFGTAAFLVLDGYSFNFGRVHNGLLYFDTGSALWVTNGTFGGTRLLVETPGGWIASIDGLSDGRLSFSVGRSATEREIWVTDATASGTRLHARVPWSGYSGEYAETVVPIVQLDDQLLFEGAEPATGIELWTIPAPNPQ